MLLEKYSMGIGDRFGRQGRAQLAAFLKARSSGVDVTPVWNKSNREHQIVHSSPFQVRSEADAAVRALGWTGAYHVDADHIGLKTVDPFIESSDFFTLDVAEETGKAAAQPDIEAFLSKVRPYMGRLPIPGLDRPLDVTRQTIEAIAHKHLRAVQEASRIYRHIEAAKGCENFITEVSMDETDQAQTPVELFFILAAISFEGIPAQTIAPKFTGRFNKGVDYAGDIERFEREFNDDLAVIAFAVREFALPRSLKLSVHSGSDKFSIYAPIRKALQKHRAGLHLKTAGTTWLEELIGLASAGGDGLTIAKEIYRASVSRYDELCRPYATVIDIDVKMLPPASRVDGWSGKQFAGALRHDPACEVYNPHFRQLLHVAYKVAAEMGERYRNALTECEETIARGVTENIFDRHLKRVFVG